MDAAAAAVTDATAESTGATSESSTAEPAASTAEAKEQARVNKVAADKAAEDLKSERVVRCQ